MHNSNGWRSRFRATADWTGRRHGQHWWWDEGDDQPGEHRGARHCDDPSGETPPQSPSSTAQAAPAVVAGGSLPAAAGDLLSKLPVETIIGNVPPLEPSSGAAGGVLDGSDLAVKLPVETIIGNVPPLEPSSGAAGGVLDASDQLVKLPVENILDIVPPGAAGAGDVTATTLDGFFLPVEPICPLSRSSTLSRPKASRSRRRSPRA